MASYTAAAARYARKYGIPTSLFDTLVRWESGGNPSIVSSAGAIGYTQLMPGTAKSLGVDPWNPQQNLDGGARYLRQQYDAFKPLAAMLGVNPWSLALAAYNAGPHAVSKYGGVPPYAETQKYVKGILAAAGNLGAPVASRPASTPRTVTDTVQPPSLPTAPFVSPPPDLTGPVLDNLAHTATHTGSPSAGLAALTSSIIQQKNAQPPKPQTQAPAPQGTVIPVGQPDTKLPVKPRTTKGQQVVQLAETFIGTPYLWGGKTPKGFDCSGLVQYVWAHKGVQIGPDTYTQWGEGRAVARGKLQPGDAVFFEPTSRGPGHVALYIGGGKVIAAPHTGDHVRVQKLADLAKQDGYVGARRYV